ncbi:ribosome assembly cofactor RimP [Crocinitomix algicola]|uniref:ribosome assembly cofactor RimP n=1 Tax=Crocinitomix algicola TaxID=1740263 RepID=UPI00082B1211|nr:ribosome assembly cofactor RimP [Crocinitomix algicola]
MIEKKVVIKLAEERISELNRGIYIVDLKIGKGNQISLELDCETGSISIEDCISVSRNIEHNLDREEEDFALEVSSAGIDQPFRVLKQYLKNVGKQVSVQTIEHGKKIEGILKSADENGIVVEVKEKQRLEGKKKKVWVTEAIALTYDEIKETKLVISF